MERIVRFFVKNSLLAIAVSIFMLTISSQIKAMDPAPHDPQKLIYVKTSDGVMNLEIWKIDQMSKILALLDAQQGSNSESNPVVVEMITQQELQLLSDALYAASGYKDGFEKFYMDLAQEDGLLQPQKGSMRPKIEYTLGDGKLRMLVNAAEKVGAAGISALCLSLFVTTDIQKKLLVPQFIKLATDYLQKKKLEKRKIELVSHLSSVFSVAFSPDGTKIISGGFGNQHNLILWDIKDPANVRHQDLVGHPQDVSSVAFSPDGTKIISSCFGGQHNLILWDIKDPANIGHQDLVGHSHDVFSVAFSPDGTKIISGGFGNQHNLILWDITNPTNISNQDLIGHSTSVRSAVFSPDGKKIISGGLGSQHNLILWNITDLANIGHQELVGHLAGVFSVAFSPDGTKVISGGDGSQHNLILWNITNPANIRHQDIVSHLGGVNSVAFSPDGKMIISGGYGDEKHRNLILWDIKDPANIRHQDLVGHPQDVSSVAFSPDGTKIISGSSVSRHNLILWSLLSDEEIKELQNLTIEQARLVYQLYLASFLTGSEISVNSASHEGMIFRTLSKNLQKLLNDLLNLRNETVSKKSGECVIF